MITRRQNHKGGFSITELLVAVAIIGVLASLLIPLWGSMRNRVNMTSCASNMRQLASGLLIYAGDNGGDFPPVSRSWPPTSQKDTWGYAIWSYVGYQNDTFREPGNDLSSTVDDDDHNIFQCPATQSDPITFPGVSSSFSSFYSYGLNCDPNGEGNLGLSIRTPVKLAHLQSPGETAMILESRFPVATYYTYRREYGLVPHSGSLNVAYYDGHVELMGEADVPAGGSAQVFWRGY